MPQQKKKMRVAKFVLSSADRAAKQAMLKKVREGTALTAEEQECLASIRKSIASQRAAAHGNKASAVEGGAATEAMNPLSSWVVVTETTAVDGATSKGKA